MRAMATDNPGTAPEPPSGSGGYVDPGLEDGGADSMSRVGPRELSELGFYRMNKEFVRCKVCCNMMGNRRGRVEEHALRHRLKSSQ